MTALQVMTSTGTVLLNEATVQAFKASLRGALLRSGDDHYESTRKVWNGMIDKRPALIVRCVGVADVIAAINFARDHHLLVSVRGGGHNIAGKAVCDGGLGFRQVEDLLKAALEGQTADHRQPGWDLTAFGYMAKTCRDEEFFSTGLVPGDCIVKATVVDGGGRPLRAIASG